ncbi:MAG: hypothetical protein AABX29_07595 [Nanoarchaeota archaeon]
MKVIPKLIIVLLVFGITFSLITISAQVGDLISGNVFKVSESTPFALMSVFVLVFVFLVIALLIVGLLRLNKKD